MEVLINADNGVSWAEQFNAVLPEGRVYTYLRKVDIRLVFSDGSETLYKYEDASNQFGDIRQPSGRQVFHFVDPEDTLRGGLALVAELGSDRYGVFSELLSIFSIDFE